MHALQASHPVAFTRSKFLAIALKIRCSIVQPRPLNGETVLDIFHRSFPLPFARWLFRFDLFTSFCPLTTDRIGFPYFLYSGTLREYHRLAPLPRSFQTLQGSWNETEETGVTGVRSILSVEIQDFGERSR